MAVSFTWLAHSSFVFDFDGHSVLLDPFLTSNPLAPVTIDALNPEVILVTHAHGDHVGDTAEGPAADTLSVARRSGATLVCNFEIGGWFMAHGLENVFQGNPGGTFTNAFMNAKFTKAFHSSSFSDGSYGGQPNGFIIRARGKTLYHAGDTDLFGDMQLIGDEGIDVAFLPIGDTFTMGVQDSIKAVKMLRPRYVVPIHYNTFPPIVQDVSHWAELINNETGAQPIVLDPGGTYTLD